MSLFTLNQIRELQLENIERCFDAAKETLVRYARQASNIGNFDDMLLLLQDVSIEAANISRNITQYKINLAEVDREIDRLPEE